MKHSDHLPCSDALDEPKYQRSRNPATSPLRGIRQKPGLKAANPWLSGLEEAGFAKGAASPRETVVIPVHEGHECDALAGGMDHPTVAEADARVVDFRRSRAAAVVPEEEDVRGLQRVERDARRLRHLPAHLVRRA